MKEKLERAGWIFQNECGIYELYKRNNDKVLYDVRHDMIAVWTKNDTRYYYPDSIQLDLIFEKLGG